MKRLGSYSEAAAHGVQRSSPSRSSTMNVTGDTGELLQNGFQSTCIACFWVRRCGGSSERFHSKASEEGILRFN